MLLKAFVSSTAGTVWRGQETVSERRPEKLSGVSIWGREHSKYKGLETKSMPGLLRTRRGPVWLEQSGQGGNGMRKVRGGIT